MTIAQRSVTLLRVEDPLGSASRANWEYHPVLEKEKRRVGRGHL